MGTFPRPCGGGVRGVIERHWGGVNPHSPCPSLSRTGHNKPRPPPPESPWWPLTPRLMPLSLAPLCLHPVIICNIYSFWFPCWSLLLLSQQLKKTQVLSFLLQHHPPKPSANITFRGNESAYCHLFMAFRFRPQGGAQKSSGQWVGKVTAVLLQGRLVVKGITCNHNVTGSIPAVIHSRHFIYYIQSN